MHTPRNFLGIILLALFLTSSLYAADPNIVEEPNSISPATVKQWSKISFSIDLKNLGDEDVRLDTDTKLHFGMGTGHAYTNMEWGALDENLCWVNLVEEAIIPAGATTTLTFERALVCGELPADVYHPQLELTGTYVNSGTSFSQTLYTQANPITVTYVDRQWATSCGVAGGAEEFLFMPNGGYCHYPYCTSRNYWQRIDWKASTYDSVPMEFDWGFGESADSDAKNYQAQLRLLRPDCSVISEQVGPPQIFRILVDNYNYTKVCTAEIAVYMNDLTVLGEKYSDTFCVCFLHPRCPHQGGMPVTGCGIVKMDVVFDSEVSCDIAAVTGPDLDVYCNEPFDVNVSITNHEQYLIVLSREPNKSYLKFTFDGNDISDSFTITPPPLCCEWTDIYPEVAGVIDANKTETFTFSILPEENAPAGEITIDPTIYCYNYFADGEDIVQIGTSRTGSSYEPPIVLSVDLNPDRDRDNDGLYNDDEVNLYGTDPDNPDTDGDGMPDGWEVKHALAPLVNDADDDADGEGADNLDEYYLGTDPQDSNQPPTVYVDCNNVSGTEDGSPTYPYNTIQEGVDSRAGPVVIKVKPGIYEEMVNLKDKQILRGSGAESSVIDGKSEGRVVTAVSINWAKITGFTITNGYGPSMWDGGGITCNDACLVITGNVLTDNHSDHGGGGICCRGPSRSPIISGNVISRNTTYWHGGGIYVNFDSGPLIINNILTHNSADESGGAIHIMHSASPIIVNNTLVDNSGGYHHIGGINCAGPCGALIMNCILWENDTNELSGCSATYSNIQDGSLCIGNIDVDPCFADANNGDYHLKSQAGRWDPNSLSWVCDDVVSRCIDAGNPGSPLRDEPNDINNVRINMGAYGGTAEASKTPATWSILADLTNDGTVDFVDFVQMAAIFTGKDNQLPGDLDHDNDIGLADLALLADDWLWQTDWYSQ